MKTITNDQNASQANIDNMLSELQGIANDSVLKEVVMNIAKTDK